MEKILAIVIVGIAYYFIIFGKKHKAPIIFGLSLLVAVLKLVEGLEPYNISKVVDLNTLGLLAGMMIIVEFLRKTGVFQFLAIKIVKIGGKHFFWTITGLMVLVAIASAFLDNLVTIILIAPMIFLITDTLGLNPIPFLMLTIVIDNIGGMSTLIGSPLNLVLGSVSGLSFNDFIVNMGLISIISFVVVIILFKRYMKVDENVLKKLEQLSTVDERSAIIDRKSMKFSVTVFVGVIIFFALHSILNVELSFIALLGAIVIMLYHKKDFADISHEIDWDTLFFYAGLYILSYALEEVGVTQSLANIFTTFGHSKILYSFVIFWFVSFAIPWLSAVPGTLIIAPMIRLLVNSGFSSKLWWVYGVSANLATNLTPLGAVQNIVGMNLLSKQIGRDFSFGEYMKWAWKPYLITSLLGFVYSLLVVTRGG
ncbi:anion permease [Thermosipho ferrireducens]|uniref:Anion permease n=1 Tax=Thermosipho ferrireducens TaxID=2571116 RepID=A0ABX7S8H1_9BACT|nr:anion permease [Thermosipho ferrireducens]